MSINPGPGTVLTLLALVAGFTFYFFLKLRHIERMAKIEKGLMDEGDPANSNFMEIKIGMLMGGIGMGLLVAFGLFEYASLSQSEVFYPAFMLLFGGGGLVLSYFVAQRLNNR